MDDEQLDPEFNEWSLEPNAEYRFELDVGAALAIKVSFLSPLCSWWY